MGKVKVLNKPTIPAAVTVNNTLTSTSTTEALSANQGKTLKDNADTHEADITNPHSVTATQVGLGNASNTSDANKPVSTAQQTALDLKADSFATMSYMGS